MACPKPGSVSELTMADKPRLSESDILDAILSAFMGGVYHGVETLEDLLGAMTDQAVVMLHESIHKHFGD